MNTNLHIAVRAASGEVRRSGTSTRGVAARRSWSARVDPKPTAELAIDKRRELQIVWLGKDANTLGGQIRLFYASPELQGVSKSQQTGTARG